MATLPPTVYVLTSEFDDSYDQATLRGLYWTRDAAREQIVTDALNGDGARRSYIAEALPQGDVGETLAAACQLAEFWARVVPAVREAVASECGGLVDLLNAVETCTSASNRQAPVR